MIDFSAWKVYCLIVPILWIAASAFIMVFMHGATKKSKEFEQEKSCQEMKRSTHNDR